MGYLLTGSTGDVLLVRTGFFSAYQKLTQEERLALSKESPEVGWIGLQPSEDMLDFLHDSYFSAVVADNPSMEASPFPVGAMSLHEYLLPLWGVPIGELWDLEKLSEICEKKGGWKFLVTSAPFNMDGNVASWANAIAIV